HSPLVRRPALALPARAEAAETPDRRSRLPCGLGHARKPIRIPSSGAVVVAVGSPCWRAPTRRARSCGGEPTGETVGRIARAPDDLLTIDPAVGMRHDGSAGRAHRDT